MTSLKVKVALCANYAAQVIISIQKPNNALQDNHQEKDKNKHVLISRDDLTRQLVTSDKGKTNVQKENN